MSPLDEGEPDLARLKASPLGYGLMSLFDMINGRSMGNIGAICGQLMVITCATDRAAENGAIRLDAFASEPEKDLLRPWLDMAEKCAEEFEWQAVKDRIKICRKKLDGNITFYQLVRRQKFYLRL